jgi:hypothetical protein
LRAKTLALWTLLAAGASLAANAQDAPRLLLPPQRLRRLQRDRERQTVRWADFETRIHSVPDSPERGFELALYFAVTQDKKSGREAVDWALSRHCERRQFQLILDWCSDLMSEEERRKLAGACPTVDERATLSSLQNGGYRDAHVLYAACEYLMRVRAAQHTDLRQEASQFFSQLPVEFLLSLKPAQVEHPDWMTHVAALALVAVDPNLEGSQYLQGWAIEDRQRIREGPGVAYEFLWADPYLPGVGYQNLDSWTYNASGRLFARTNWDADACWIAISTRGVEEENCPAGWRDKPGRFGSMILIPMTSRCQELPHLDANETAMLWRLKPNESVSYRDRKQQHSVRADAAGLARLSVGAEGKVCAAR